MNILIPGKLYVLTPQHQYAWHVMNHKRITFTYKNYPTTDRQPIKLLFFINRDACPFNLVKDINYHFLCESQIVDYITTRQDDAYFMHYFFNDWQMI